MSRPAGVPQPLHHPFRHPSLLDPEQALAVVELLDDLRALIWAHYDVRLVELIQAERAGQSIAINPTASSDETNFFTGRRLQPASDMER